MGVHGVPLLVVASGVAIDLDWISYNLNGNFRIELISMTSFWPIPDSTGDHEYSDHLWSAFE